VDRFAADPLVAPQLNRWRAELGLPPVSRVFNAWLHSPQRVLACFPDWFGEPQSDWPAQVRVTGFLLSDESCAPDARGTPRPPADAREDPAGAAELEQFLSSGAPPIAFTPGSANRHAAPFFEAAIEATRRIGRRALLVTAYREQLPPSLPPHVHHAAYAPLKTLFPRTAAAVHHGGIGTCAQALAAGVPQLLMPMAFDQPDNAARIAKLRAGRWLSPARFRAPDVAAALQWLLSSSEVAAACRQWQERMKAVNAVGLACDLVEKQFARRSARAAPVGAGSFEANRR
jgi:UDP:flavonoid glycosyltransferase YjiC (YdhE family)